MALHLCIVPHTDGDPFLAGSRFERQTAQRLAAVFGDGFARAALPLPVGSFQGPVASSFGLHLVRIEERSEASLPPLARIRPQVAAAWLANRRAREGERARAALRAKYRIEIAPDLAEGPAPAQATQP